MAEAAESAARPWLARYSTWVPAQLKADAPSALDMFRRSAAAQPEGPAVHYFERTLTYGELDRDSSALAAGLSAQGVHSGDRVAVYLQNDPQFAVAMLAIWKLGGVLVPVNPMLKTQELNHQLVDSGSRAVVALESLSETVESALAGTAVTTVVTTSPADYATGSGGTEGSRFGRLLAAHRGEPVPLWQSRPDDLAMLTYTSGTTGRPKGAMNTHGNVAFTSEVFRTWLRLGRDDVVLGAAPLFHITGLIGHLTAAWLAGIPLVLFHRFEAGEALRLAERWRATYVIASITAFLALMNHPEIEKRDLSSLSKVCSGGAPISPATVRRFQELTGSYIHSFYGLTETTSPSHAVPLGGAAPVDPEFGALAVGLPVPSTEVKVMDPDTGRELPAGELGEIWIRGPQVVPGYWQRPDATEESFSDGFLHTGDVGRMDAQGWFYVVDRIKDMINASGYKVWPREVEDLLYQHPAVREAAVIGVPDPYRGETVKAFVSLRAGEVVGPEELIHFCRDRIAAYKAPRLVELVEEVPKTATGKFLRRKLRESL